MKEKLEGMKSFRYRKGTVAWAIYRFTRRREANVAAGFL
jgi:hypothetical protein